MKLEVTTGQFDDFELEKNQWAYANGKFYEVWVSKKLWTVGCCLGHMRVILNSDKSLEWCWPLMGAPDPYEFVTQEQINKYWQILQAFENRNK